MFRIDRNLVNLSTMRTIRVDREDIEADAEGSESPDAAAFTADIDSIISNAQEMMDLAESKIANAKEEAAKIISEARDESAQILLNARDEAEEVRRSAWEDGFEKGSEEGKHSFDDRLAEKIREDDERVKRVIQELYDERERTHSELEKEVVGLAMGIVRKIINPDEEGSFAFEALIRNALKQINPSGKIIIRVGDDDYERFFSQGGIAFELDRGVMVSPSIMRDVSLKEGDCIIDMEDTTVNAGLDSQMKYIELAFERAVN